MNYCHIKTSRLWVYRKYSGHVSVFTKSRYCQWCSREWNWLSVLWFEEIIPGKSLSSSCQGWSMSAGGLVVKYVLPPALLYGWNERQYCKIIALLSGLIEVFILLLKIPIVSVVHFNLSPETSYPAFRHTFRERESKINKVRMGAVGKMCLGLVSLFLIPRLSW